jgi:hypothetical protein
MSGRPVEKIWQIASFDPSIRGKVALELVASWPIPAGQRNAQLGYWFFYYAMFGPPPAPNQKVWPPSWKVWIDAQTGEISDLMGTTAREMGLEVPDGEPFATHVWPKDWTYEDAERKRQELLAAYDAVVRLWEKLPASAVGSLPEVVRFRELFRDLTPGALMPCYKVLGPDFFRWVGL